MDQKVAVFYLVLGTLIGAGYCQNIGTTAFPEICRVMALYRNCSDILYRIACPGECSGSITIDFPGFTYIPATGKAYGIAKTNKQIWAYAQEICFAYNGRIADMGNQVEADVIKYMEETVSADVNHDDIYIGCNSWGLDQTIYYDGELNQVPTSGSKSFWDSGYPQNSATSTCCWTRKGTYKIRSSNCGDNWTWLCETEPTIAVEES